MRNVVVWALVASASFAWLSAAQSSAATQGAAAARVSFGDRGELIVDGKPRFIRGGYRSGQFDGFVDALQSARDAHFDLVHDYRFEQMNVADGGAERYIRDARTYLQRAEQLGLGVFLGLPRSAVSAADEAALGKIVTALSGERALWMWYVYDEPHPNELSVDAAARVYALLHRLDPQRPAIMLTNKESTMRMYHPYCDVLWFDRYPITASGQKKASLMPTAEVRRAAKQIVPASKPVWSVLQVHDNKGSPKYRKKAGNKVAPVSDGNHRPNEAEIRAQAHVAIANGAMASVFYWGPEQWYSMRTQTPGVWRSLAKVLGELGELEPVLLAPEATGSVSLDGGGPAVMMWTRRHDGHTYVGVVNADINAPAQVAVRVDGSEGFRQLAGDGSASTAAQGLNVRLGPAGVVVVAIGSR